MFKLLQWSDSHLNKNGVTAMQTLIPNVPDIDFVIHCGDITYALFPEGIGNFDGTKSVCVIGNHDAWQNNGDGPVHLNPPTQAQLYERYFKVSKDAFNLEMNVNETWWSKTITSKNLMILGLNDTAVDATLDSELKWLNEKLKQAASSNLDVVAVKHGVNRYENLVTCNFTAPYMLSEGFTSDQKEYIYRYPRSDELIGTLLKSNANIICLLCGHEHGDAFGYMFKSNGKKIPVIHVGSTYIDVYNDAARSSDSNKTSSVVCNMIEYDDACKTLRIYRIGADTTISGSTRKMLVYSYEKEDIVSACSNN